MTIQSEPTLGEKVIAHNCGSDKKYRLGVWLGVWPIYLHAYTTFFSLYLVIAFCFGDYSINVCRRRLYAILHHAKLINLNSFTPIRLLSPKRLNYLEMECESVYDKNCKLFRSCNKPRKQWWKNWVTFEQPQENRNFELFRRITWEMCQKYLDSRRKYSEFSRSMYITRFLKSASARILYGNALIINALYNGHAQICACQMDHVSRLYRWDLDKSTEVHFPIVLT